MDGEELKLLLMLEAQNTGLDAIDAVARSLEGVAGSSKVAQVAVMGLAAGIGVFVGVGAALAGATVAAADWQTKMVDVANNTNMTNAQIGQMQDAILTMGRTTSAPLSQLADGWMHITNMGFGAADATQILQAAMESAVSTGADVGQTANVLANVLHEFGLSGNQAAAAMDQLHTSAALGNLTLEQLVNSFGPLAAIASTVGVPLDQVAAAEAAMSRHGFDAAEASVQLKNMIERIAAPSAGAQKEIAHLAQTTGVDLTQDFSQAGLASKGLTGVLDDIARATHGNVDAFAQLTGNVAPTTEQLNQLQAASNGDLAAIKGLEPNIRGLYAAFILTGRGAGDYLDILRQVDASTQGAGITADSYARKQETVSFQLGVLKNNLQIAGIELGQQFLPALTRALEWVNSTGIPVVEALAAMVGGALKPAFDAVVGAIASVTAALQSGGLAGALGQILTIVGNLAGQMFSAGWNLVQQLGAGIVQAAESIIVDAANYVASLIASFLIGSSPPPQGPLSQIVQGGVNTMAAYVGGLKQGTVGVADVANQVSTAFKAISTQSGTDLLAKNFADAKAQLLTMKDAGAEVSKAMAGVDEQIQAITFDQRQATFAADQIKQSYEGQIQPLQDQLDALKGQVDYTTQLADANDRVALAQDQQRILAAQGDPVKRAALQTQLDQVRQQAQEQDLQAQILDLEHKKQAAAGDPAKLDALNLKLQELNLQQQIADLADKPALAAAQADKAKVENTMAMRNAEQAVTDEQRKQQELKLEQQIAAKKDLEKEALAPITAQLEGYKQQLAVLNLQKGELSDLKALIQANATEAGNLASKLQPVHGGAGGLHPGVGHPAGGVAGGAGAPAAAQTMKAAMDSAMSDVVTSMQARANEAAQKFVAGFKTGLENFPAALAALPGQLVAWVGPALPPLLARLGTLVGQVGAWVAATGAPMLAAALQRFTLAAWQWVGDAAPPLLARLGALLAAVGTWIATTGAPALLDHLAAWGEAFVRWIAPIDAQLLRTLGGLLADLGAWIVGTALPAIAAQLQRWATAFSAWIGPAATALKNNLGPMLDALGGWIFDTAIPALRDDLQQLGTWFMRWVAPAIPPMIAELAKLLVQLTFWILAVAIPKVSLTLLSLAVEFSKWVAPRIIILLAELTTLLEDLLHWIVFTAAPAIAKAALELGKAIVTGTLEGLKDIGQQLATVLRNAIQGININVGPFHLNASGFTIDAPQLPSLPGRAGGGPVSYGAAYVVGERGPEVFVPNSNGTILPNVGGGGGNIILYITGNTLLNQRGIDDLATQVGRVLVQQSSAAYPLIR